MAFISNPFQDSTICSSDSSAMAVPPSFISVMDEDPYLNGAMSINYPDARRNILQDINNVECTVLPTPPEKESLKVFLRVKPTTSYELQIVRENSGEQDAKMEEIVKVESEHQVALSAPKESKAYKNCINGQGKMIHRYSFSKIFSPEASQKEIFSRIVQPRVKDFLEGQNQLLLTYGATSAGKTYTMQGTPQDPGLMPQALDTIFETISERISDSVPIRPTGFNRVSHVPQSEMASLNKEKAEVFQLGVELLKKDKAAARNLGSSQHSIASTCSGSSQASSVMSHSLELSKLDQIFPNYLNRIRCGQKLGIRDEGITYAVWISFAEIYNECVYDLFQKVPEPKKKGESLRRKVLRLCEDNNGSTYIKDLTEILVTSSDEAYLALMIGRENLQFAATKLNQNSSRSHCIFTVKLIRVADSDNPHLARVSILSFCDLAGSERISKTHNTGSRQKEAGNINTSLLVLGRCIKAIRANQALEEAKRNIVPFREAKLTRLIKTFFSGLGKASLVVCISQAQYLFDETVHVLKFASIASKVTVEQQKEVVKPPQQTQQNGHQRKSRFSSMIAGGKRTLGTSILSGRGSIQWEIPPSRSTLLPGSSMFPPSFAPSIRSTICPPVIEGNEDLDETEQEIVMETKQYNILLDLIEDLKQKLIDERKKNSVLESNLREELCQEFSALMVEVEQNWEHRLKEERQHAQELSEWRINELQKACKAANNRKRKRQISDSESESEVKQVEALEARLGEKEQEKKNIEQQLEDNTQVLKAVKETLSLSQAEQNRLQEANSTLQFQLAEQQRLCADLGRDLMSCKTRLEAEQKLNSDRSSDEESEVSTLKLQVSRLMADLGKKEEEANDMKELLQEAGDEYLAKVEEGINLQNVIKDLENQLTQHGISMADVLHQLEESHIQLQEATNQMDDKDARIEEMEELLEKELKDKKLLTKEVESLQSQLDLGTEKGITTEKYLADMKEGVQEAKGLAIKEKETLTGMERKLTECQMEKQELLSARAKLLEEVAELKKLRINNSQDVATNIHLDELKNDLERSEKVNKELVQSLGQAKQENSDLKQKLELLSTQAEQVTTKIDDSLVEDDDDIAQMKTQLDSFKTRLQVEKELSEKQLAAKCDELQLSEGQLAVKCQLLQVLEGEKSKLSDQVARFEALNSELTGTLGAAGDLTRENLISAVEVYLRELEALQAETKVETEKSAIKDNSVLDFELAERLIEKEEEQQQASSVQSIVDEVDGKMSMFAMLRQKISAAILEDKQKAEAVKREGETAQRREETARTELDIAQKKAETAQKQLEQLKEKLTSALENQEATEKVLEDMVATNDAELKKLQEEIGLHRKRVEELTAEKEVIQRELDALTKDRADLVAKCEAAEGKLGEFAAEKEELEKRIEVLTDKLNEKDDDKVCRRSMFVTVQGRADSLEKELVTKDTYIRELEDIIVEKEFKISELEKAANELQELASAGCSQEERKQLEQKIKSLEEEKQRLEADLNTELEAQRQSNQSLTLKVTKLEAEEKERQKITGSIEQKEEERRSIEIEHSNLLAKYEKLKVEVKEYHDELKVLKRATKHSAIQEQELVDSKAKNKELEQEISRVKALEEARKREEDALNLLRDELRSKKEENTSLREKVDFLKASEEAKDYEVKKAKDDRENLMAHYESLFKKKQQELNTEKMRNCDSVKLQEAIARATPTKKNELRELSAKLCKTEEENRELKIELTKLERQFEELKAGQERELKRMKLASDLVIKQYKETNIQLQKQIGGSSTDSTPSVSRRTSDVQLTVTDASTLEADDDKSESSWIELTPVVKKSMKSRNKGRGNKSGTRNSSLASFEDSNTENDPEPSKGKLGRRPRVGSTSSSSRGGRGGARASSSRKDVTYLDVHDESMKRKRVLKEKQLSPVSETEASKGSKSDREERGGGSGREDRGGASGRDSDFATPALRKKRKLYSMTPIQSQMFTPPTDTENQDSPHSVVQRQLRTRTRKKN